jgi:hypothetical protein
MLQLEPGKEMHGVFSFGLRFESVAAFPVESIIQRLIKGAY